MLASIAVLLLGVGLDPSVQQLSMHDEYASLHLLDAEHVKHHSIKAKRAAEAASWQTLLPLVDNAEKKEAEKQRALEAEEAEWAAQGAGLLGNDAKYATDWAAVQKGSWVVDLHNRYEERAHDSDNNNNNDDNVDHISGQRYPEWLARERQNPQLRMPPSEAEEAAIEAEKATAQREMAEYLMGERKSAERQASDRIAREADSAVKARMGFGEEEAIPEAPAQETVPKPPAEEAVQEAPADEEAVPEAPAEEAVPETSAEEAVPETSAEEAVPEASAEEAVPEASAEEAVPEASAEEAVPEASAEEAEAAAADMAAAEKAVAEKAEAEKAAVEAAEAEKEALANLQKAAADKAAAETAEVEKAAAEAAAAEKAQAEEAAAEKAAAEKTAAETEEAAATEKALAEKAAAEKAALPDGTLPEMAVPVDDEMLNAQNHGFDKMLLKPDNRDMLMAPQLRPQVLVIVSDHGGGTTQFGQAISEHPCIFDLGEPFAAIPVKNPRVWSRNAVPECNQTTITDAIFDADTKTIMKPNNPVLTERILSLGPHILPDGTRKRGHKEAGMYPVGLTGDMPSLYENLPYSFAEYFVRVRDLVCSGVPEKVCPPSDCTISIKMFPQFFNANTAGQLTKEKFINKCTIVRNEMATPAWKAALMSIVEHPRVASFTLTRNEVERQFSVFHRFAPTGTAFDCNVPRPMSTFMTLSKDYTDREMAVEDCWSGADGANKCLSDALQLVGLSTEPMGTRGTFLMGGSNLDSSAQHEHAAAHASCKTDPSAMFKRLSNDDVQMITCSPDQPCESHTMSLGRGGRRHRAE